MQNETLIIAGVGIPALIIGVIQFLKRFFPDAHSNVWVGLSAVLSLGFWTVAFVADSGLPTTLKGVLALVVLAVNFMLSSAATYDRTLGSK